MWASPADFFSEIQTFLIDFKRSTSKKNTKVIYLVLQISPNFARWWINLKGTTFLFAKKFKFSTKFELKIQEGKSI
jgi:hypothetical protein